MSCNRMLMISRCLAMAAALAAGATQHAALADPLPHMGNYGVHMGYAKTRDAQSGDALFGGHFELDPIPFIGVQGALDYRSSEWLLVSDGSVRDRVQVRSIPVTLSGRLYLPAGPGLNPFVTAGAGWYRQDYRYSGVLHDLGFQDQTVSTFGWHLGGGVKIATPSRLSVYGEARYVFLDPSRNLNANVREQMRNIDYNSMYLAGGVSVDF